MIMPTMSWQENNQTHRILTAAEKGGYGVLAAIV
jgi:fructose-bisphosphate aldolase class II